MPLQTLTTATIAIGNSQSGAIKINDLDSAGFIATGSVVSAASLTFLVSVDNSNFYPFYKTDGTNTTEYTVGATSASRAYSLNLSDFYPWNFIKIREGTSASAVNQATYDAVFTFVAKSV